MSCLFDSLAQFVNMHTNDLRQGICDFLQTNPKLSEDMTAENVVHFESGVPLERYVANMRQPTVMGGATEIKAFCIIFKKNVKVKSEPNDKVIEFIVSDNFPFVWLRWTGGHYDPVFKEE